MHDAIPEIAIRHEAPHLAHGMRELCVMTGGELHTFPIRQVDQLHSIGGIQGEGFLDICACARLQALPADREVTLGRCRHVHNIGANCGKHVVDIRKPLRNMESFC